MAEIATDMATKPEAALAALGDLTANASMSRRPRSIRRYEGFTGDYDLPNETAYAETCAAVALSSGQQDAGHGTQWPYDDIMEWRL